MDDDAQKVFALMSRGGATSAAWAANSSACKLDPRRQMYLDVYDELWHRRDGQGATAWLL